MNRNNKQNEAPLNVVVIDGRNVAYDSGVTSFNDTRLLCCVRYFHSHSYEMEIHTIIPLWGITDENLEKLYELSHVHKVGDLHRDKERDDKHVIGTTIIENGFYVSLDKNMHKHIKNNLIDKSWCKERRIGFKFIGEQFKPIFPNLWGMMIENQSSAKKEVIV